MAGAPAPGTGTGCPAAYYHVINTPQRSSQVSCWPFVNVLLPGKYLPYYSSIFGILFMNQVLKCQCWTRPVVPFCRFQSHRLQSVGCGLTMTRMPWRILKSILHDLFTKILSTPSMQDGTLCTNRPYFLYSAIYRIISRLPGSPSQLFIERRRHSRIMSSFATRHPACS